MEAEFSVDKALEIPAVSPATTKLRESGREKKQKSLLVHDSPAMVMT